MNTLSNRELAQQLYRNPGNHRLIVFAYCPVDVNPLPDEATLVVMGTVPADWRHIAETQVVIAHDGKHLAKPLRAAELCLRFDPWELLMWRVTDNTWTCVKDGVGKVIKRVPGMW